MIKQYLGNGNHQICFDSGRELTLNDEELEQLHNDKIYELKKEVFDLEKKIESLEQERSDLEDDIVKLTENELKFLSDLEK